LSNKQLWVLAGGNGAGKSTFYQTQLKPLGLPFVNADVIAKQLYPHDAEKNSYNAAKIAEKLRLKLISDGQSFCFETVFSHPSKIDFVAHAKAHGYQVILVFIHLNLTSLNQARISQRINEGGHSVPEDKVSSRIPRVLTHIKTTLPLCDEVTILDNSSIDNPFQPLVLIKENTLKIHQPTLPSWCKILIDEYHNIE